jgi:hypothetical protein
MLTAAAFPSLLAFSTLLFKVVLCQTESNCDECECNERNDGGRERGKHISLGIQWGRDGRMNTNRQRVESWGNKLICNDMYRAFYESKNASSLFYCDIFVHIQSSHVLNFTSRRGQMLEQSVQKKSYCGFEWNVTNWNIPFLWQLVASEINYFEACNFNVDEWLLRAVNSVGILIDFSHHESRSFIKTSKEVGKFTARHRAAVLNI